LNELLTVIEPTAEMLPPEADEHRFRRDEIVSELLFGERFRGSLPGGGEFAHGKSIHDSYSGRIRKGSLARETWEPTHLIVKPTAIAFMAPSSAAPVRFRLSFGSRVAVRSEADRWSECGAEFWIPSSHLIPIPEGESGAGQVVEYALGLLDAPYRYGGRSAFGIDCSGLIQLCLNVAGVEFPRDTEQQWMAPGRRMDWKEGRRVCHPGDLFYLSGHAGVVCGDGTAVHSSGHWMRVAREPIAEIERRARQQGQDLLGFLRWA
jgi:hypothetical protein